MISTYGRSERMFDIVVATDAQWGIGKANGLPWPKLSADLAHFRAVTSQLQPEDEGKRNAIIMGRKTWQSTEVKGRPLPRRINCVISRSPLQVPDGVRTATSLNAALLACDDAATIFVVGGAEIYRIALADARLRYVYWTQIFGDFDCDIKMPALDEFVQTAWAGEAVHLENNVGYKITRLARRPQ
jgi:dihydrofolate reductase